jgi:hypothetical protein
LFQFHPALLIRQYKSDLIAGHSLPTALAFFQNLPKLNQEKRHSAKFGYDLKFFCKSSGNYFPRQRHFFAKRLMD